MSAPRDESNVRLAARMYEMRDAAKAISVNYPEHIAQWKAALQRVCDKLQTGPLQAVPMICKAHPMSDADVMWLAESRGRRWLEKP